MKGRHGSFDVNGVKWMISFGGWWGYRAGWRPVDTFYHQGQLVTLWVAEDVWDEWVSHGEADLNMMRAYNVVKIALLRGVEVPTNQT